MTAMNVALPAWLLYAIGSAFFAALTAIFAKIGVVEMNSDLATLIRTLIILIVTAAIVSARGAWQAPSALPTRAVLFLVLSGIATGLSWLCYFRALQIGPVPGVVAIDKLSVVFVVALAALLIGERLTWQAVVGSFLVAAGALLVSLSTPA